MPTTIKALTQNEKNDIAWDLSMMAKDLDYLRDIVNDYSTTIQNLTMNPWSITQDIQDAKEILKHADDITALINKLEG